jgi:hypothetical protein
MRYKLLLTPYLAMILKNSNDLINEGFIVSKHMSNVSSAKHQIKDENLHILL